MQTIGLHRSSPKDVKPICLLLKLAHKNLLFSPCHVLHMKPPRRLCHETHSPSHLLLFLMTYDVFTFPLSQSLYSIIIIYRCLFLFTDWCLRGSSFLSSSSSIANFFSLTINQRCTPKSYLVISSQIGLRWYTVYYTYTSRGYWRPL